MDAQTWVPDGNNAELERVMEAGRDALTDDIVTRLSATSADALELIDKLTRSGLGNAIPVLAELVNNGDLERLVHLARVVGSAEDALTDDIVGRLGETVAGSLDLLDRINRSGLDKAIPTLSRLIADGDLDRLVDLARMVGSAQDALTDDIVGRLGETLASSLDLADRFTRGGGSKVVGILDRLEASGSLERIAVGLPQILERIDSLQHMLESLTGAVSQAREAPPAAGGIGGIWRLLSDRENQETLRFFLAIGKRLRSEGLPGG